MALHPGAETCDIVSIICAKLDSNWSIQGVHRPDLLIGNLLCSQYSVSKITVSGELLMAYG